MLLLSSNNDSSNSILINGGTFQTYEKEFKPTIKALPVKGKKLDLIMLSHIDNDHVLGLLDLLEEIKSDREANVDEL